MIKYQTEIKMKNIPKNIRSKINHLNIKYVKSKEKVAYYYEDIESKTILSFNENMTFYAASTIKIVAILYLYENKIEMNQKIEITPEELKGGSGILKEEELPKEYSLKTLAIYALKYSDNTAYLKLVEWIGKEKLETFGKKLGAKHVMEGKDNYGITSCADMRIFWELLYEYSKMDKELCDALENPSYKIISPKSIQNQNFLRKYGSLDIAYHECGMVTSSHPYYLFIMTQKGKTKHSKKFMNMTAKKITNIHNKIQKIKQREDISCQNYQK